MNLTLLGSLSHTTSLVSPVRSRMFCVYVLSRKRMRGSTVLDHGNSTWRRSVFVTSLKQTKAAPPAEKMIQKPKKKAGKELQHSILEEVLLHEKQKPNTFGGKAAEAATNTFMYVAVAAGVALIGVFGYVLFGEFFSEDSPQTIFNKSLALIRADGRCLDLFGPSISGFGEKSARGRRNHVAHHKFEKDGHQRIRVLFHVKGERDEGIAQAEMELKDGEWTWRFLYVETSRRPKTTHILIDNRCEASSVDLMEDGGFKLVLSKNRKKQALEHLLDTWKRFVYSHLLKTKDDAFQMPRGSLEDVELALEKAANVIKSSRLHCWLVEKLADCLASGNRTLKAVFVIGNGHFDGSHEPGTYQLATLLSIAKLFDVPIHYQDPVASEAELEWLKGAGVMVRKQFDSQIDCSVAAADEVFLVAMIHVPHALQQEFLRFNWKPEARTKFVLIGNHYNAETAILLRSVNEMVPYEETNDFLRAARTMILPAEYLEKSPTAFSQSAIMYVDPNSSL